jgi:hypothetical protein
MADYNTQSPRCTIDYQLVFEPDNARIVVKKSQPHPLAGGYLYGGLKSARLVLFYMKTWYCPTPYYYFNLATDLCDDACAAYLYGNQTAGQSSHVRLAAFRVIRQTLTCVLFAMPLLILDNLSMEHASV